MLDGDRCSALFAIEYEPLTAAGPSPHPIDSGRSSSSRSRSGASRTALTTRSREVARIAQDEVGVLCAASALYNRAPMRAERREKAGVRGGARRAARWLRKPVVHFFAIGAILFALQGGRGDPSLDRVIRVSAERVAALRSDFELRRGRSPTPAESAALARRFVDEEVLVREALALGLDRDDLIVRRRLVQKMEFLIRDLSQIEEPGDAALEAYLLDHADRYVRPPRVDLTHVFLGGHRGENLEANSSEVLAALARGEDPARLGDPFIVGRSVRQRSERQLRDFFGFDFAREVMNLQVAEWVPVRSSYGLHLVRVDEHVAGAGPDLEGVRERVREDWLRDDRAEANRRALASLRSRYLIEGEAEEPAP